MEGWIKMHRKMMSWEWYTDSETVHLLLHCILRANHEPKRWQGHEIKRGQFISGRKKLSIETGISEKGIRTRLERLQNGGELAIKTASKFSIITVCKYEEYQEAENRKGQHNGHRPASKGPAKGQQRATNKNEKNEKNEKNNTEPAGAVFNDEIF
jgi:hypothetical protein